jgi:Ca2+-binding EF-hand superfamily protein
LLPFHTALHLRRLQVIISLSSSGFERHMCLHRAFEHFDANGDGKVTLSEFATALQLLKPKPTTEQLMTLFRFFDPNNTGEAGIASMCVCLWPPLLLT